MIRADMTDVRALRRDLEAFSRKAWPYANRSALNGMAFAGRREYRDQMQQRLTLRNRWTINSVQVQTARGTDPRRQMAVTGSVAPYMADTEFGTTHRPQGRTGVPLATSRAAGQPRGVPRTRVPSRRNRLSNIKLGGKAVTPKTPAQRLVLLARQAVETGRRQIYHDGRHGPRRGIYQVRGGSLQRPRGWPRGAKLDMLWDLSRDSVRQPATPLLGPAAQSVERRGPDLYVEAIRYQIERQRLFRKRR